ncbi:DciA family protein [Undibacterium sp. TJN19]|uniref:DciA family protein n=1 Tax=Undibacterium sp. TJN19 TaxID=3413055 RepID=UPI003BF006D9
MSTSSRPSYPINIKRGRKVPGASGAADFLRSNDKISPLLPTVQRNLALQKDCGAILPPIFETCEVMQVSEGQLILSAPNAALATKLKQQCPKLQLNLQERGWQINAIRIKVQVKRVIEKPVATKQIAFTGKALQAFGNLEHALEDTPQNAALRAALGRLLKRHQTSG